MSVDALEPRELRAGRLAKLTPTVKVLRLGRCSKVSEYHIKLLANKQLRIHTLALGGMHATTRGWFITNTAIRALSKMITLRTLRLRFCNMVTPQGLRILSALKHLDQLSLSKGTSYKGEAWWTALALLTGLTSLNLFGCFQLDSAGVSHLVHLPLKVLSLDNIEGAGVTALAQLQSLTNLHLATWQYPLDVQLSGALACTPSVLTGLHTLALRNCPLVPNKSIKLLVTPLPRLQHLSLQQQRCFGDEELRGLMGGTNGEPRHLGGLKSLDISGSAVTGTFLGCLSELQALTFLGFGTPYWPLGCRIFDTPDSNAARPPKEELAKLTQLQVLAARGMDAPEEVVDPALQLPGLRSLSLEGRADVTPFPPFDVAACGLSLLTDLEHLDLSRHSLQLHQLSLLMNSMVSLETIHLVACMPEPAVVQLCDTHPRVSVNTSAVPVVGDVPGGWCAPLYQLPCL